MDDGARADREFGAGRFRPATLDIHVHRRSRCGIRAKSRRQPSSSSSRSAPVHGVAAEVTQESRALFHHGDVDAAREQQAQHDSGGTAADTQVVGAVGAVYVSRHSAIFASNSLAGGRVPQLVGRRRTVAIRPSVVRCQTVVVMPVAGPRVRHRDRSRRRVGQLDSSAAARASRARGLRMSGLPRSRVTLVLVLLVAVATSSRGCCNSLTGLRPFCVFRPDLVILRAMI